MIDPYKETLEKLGTAFREAFIDSGSMTEEEFETIQGLAISIRARLELADPHSLNLIPSPV